MAVIANYSSEHLVEELRRAERVLEHLSEKRASYPVLRFCERHVAHLHRQLLLGGAAR